MHYRLSETKVMFIECFTVMEYYGHNEFAACGWRCGLLGVN